MTTINTHQAVSEELVGRPVSVESGFAIVELETTSAMRVDDRGLVHGGFVYGVADYAAMLAVNEPTVVLAASEVTYRSPTTVGDVVRATAEVVDLDDGRPTVDCTARLDTDTVAMEGIFECAVPSTHVLD